MDAAAFRTTKQVDVAQLGESVELLRPHGELVGDAAVELRDRFLAAVDAGATDVVVDLQAVAGIDEASLELLVAMSDLMRGRSGRLWLAVLSPETGAGALLPVDACGLEGLLGLLGLCDIVDGAVAPA